MPLVCDRVLLWGRMRKVYGPMLQRVCGRALLSFIGGVAHVVVHTYVYISPKKVYMYCAAWGMATCIRHAQVSKCVVWLRSNETPSVQCDQPSLACLGRVLRYREDGLRMTACIRGPQIYAGIDSLCLFNSCLTSHQWIDQYSKCACVRHTN